MREGGFPGESRSGRTFPHAMAAVGTRDTPVTARERGWQEAAPALGATRFWGGSGHPGSAWTMWGSCLLRACGARGQRGLPGVRAKRQVCERRAAGFTRAVNN